MRQKPCVKNSILKKEMGILKVLTGKNPSIDNNRLNSDLYSTSFHLGAAHCTFRLIYLADACKSRLTGT